jgi:hypothetical protein
VTGAPLAAPESGTGRQPAGSLDRLLELPGLRAVVAGTSKDPNAKVTVLFFPVGGGGPAMVAKVPTTDAAAVAVERERRLLDAVGELDLGPLRRTVPRVLGTLEFGGRPVVLMTAVPGTPMSTAYHGWRHRASPASVTADFRAAAAWLEVFQRRTATTWASDQREPDLAAPLGRRFAADPVVAQVVDRLRGLQDSIVEAGCRPAAVQGDLWFGNVLLAGRSVSGVVDWEHGALAGHPARDWARFALGYALYLDRHTAAGRRVRGHRGLRAGAWGAGVVHAVEGAGWFPTLFREFLEHGLTRMGGPPWLWRHVALLGIAEVAAVADHDAFARHHLDLFRRLAGPRS